jgi:hypothetical protein
MIWLEIRCDSQSADDLPHNDGGIDDHDKYCWSLIGGGHEEKMFADATKKSIWDSYKELSDQLLSAGWIKHKRGHVCPVCAKKDGLL